MQEAPILEHELQFAATIYIFLADMAEGLAASLPRYKITSTEQKTPSSVLMKLAYPFINYTVSPLPSPFCFLS